MLAVVWVLRVLRVLWVLCVLRVLWVLRVLRMLRVLMLRVRPLLEWPVRVLRVWVLRRGVSMGVLRVLLVRVLRLRGP